MKRGVRWILPLACLALLLLACSALVEGPVLLNPPVKAQAETPDAPRLSEADALPAEMGQSAGNESAVQRRFIHREQPRVENAACVREADGNGYPVTGRTYVRTVYAACPLEDMPG